MDRLDQKAKDFIDELKSREDVEAIVLFGSYARGNQRPDSDIDLMVVSSKETKREVANRNGQNFEIIQATVDNAKAYYESNIEGAYRFWKLAIVLHDPKGKAAELKSSVDELTAGGKKKLDNNTIDHFRFDALDQIAFARAAYYKGDVAVANLILTSKIAAQAEIYFDTIQKWRPAPKQLLGEIAKENKELHSLLVHFYSEDISFKDKLKTAEEMVYCIFDNNQAAEK